MLDGSLEGVIVPVGQILAKMIIFYTCSTTGFMDLLGYCQMMERTEKIVPTLSPTSGYERWQGEGGPETHRHAD